MSSEVHKKRTISVAQLFNECPPDLGLEYFGDFKSSGSKQIDSELIQKLGLALAGFPDYVHSGRIQIIGSSEISYLGKLNSTEATEAIEKLPLHKISCIVVTKGLKIPDELIRLAAQNKTIVFTTPRETSTVITFITGFLQKKLAETITLHGVFIGMYELGVLVLGRSGIGKSECALDLILRGHRLISDDAVVITKNRTFLIGESPEITKEYLEIRGLGILNVKDVFGLSAIGTGGKIDLCINLNKWEDSHDIDRLGLEIGKETILGCEIPSFCLPVSSGRNLSTLIETAVRIYLLKESGRSGVEKVIRKHNAAVSSNS